MRTRRVFGDLVRGPFAFTILEVLIALTASLLMMLALTKAFKVIGDKITQSQSELELSGNLRAITFTMRDELNQLTPEMVAPQPRNANSGYFTYYEGPWADGTTALINNVGPQPGYLPTSRYGDLDDFVAYTAEARDGSPFVGLIPRGIIEARRYQAHIAAGNTSASFVTFDGTAIGSYTLANAFELVPFYSNFAEIAYFITPTWNRDALGQPIYDAAGNPTFMDIVNEVDPTAVTGDNLPDRMQLRRRVLLVRPDLNMTLREMDVVNASVGGSTHVVTLGSDEDIEQLPILVPGGGADAVIRPLASQDIRFQAGPWNPTFTGTWPAGLDDAFRPSWLTGVARVQQMMDLSVARITNTWSPVGGGLLGMPADTSPSTGGAANLAANSLQSLTRPENRFAHVRMPSSVFSGTAGFSTMPLLALSQPHPYLTAAEQLAQASAPTADDRFGQGLGGSPATYGPLTMVGFLRPEFALVDFSVANRTTPGTTISRTFRGGSDIIATDVIGFDVQIFDPNVPNFVWMGTSPQNLPGAPGVDDDGDGTIDELDELGYANSDDAFISVNSPAIRPLNGTAPSIFGATAVGLPAGAGNEYLVTAPGEFVDFGFARQPGGMIGGFNAIDGLAAGPRRTFHNLFSTDFSGLSYVDSGGATFSRYPIGWQQSGKFVEGTTAAVSSFVQPTIDTWTESYDGDGFQQGVVLLSGGTFNATGSTQIEPPAAGTFTRVWTSTLEPSSTGGPGFSSGSSGSSQSQPPVSVMPRAVKISIRVYDREAGEIRQQSVIQQFNR